MADLERMLNIQDLGSPSQFGATGAVIGGAVGTAFGNPIMGAAIGSGVGTVVSNVIPQYSHVKGSTAGINFVTSGLKPYMIMLYTPTTADAKMISDYYCYYGCKTLRSEPMAIANYMYNGHAYVRGTLQYNGLIPLDKFAKIQAIFEKGVHVLQA